MTDNKPSEGRRLAISRDAFFESNSGTFLSGAPEGKYLRNRLEVAFVAGWDARGIDAAAPAGESAEPVATADGWLPIESAPKDGSDFLVDAPDMVCGVTIAYLKSGKLHLSLNGKPFAAHVERPKFWQPLPPPPKAAGDEG